MMLWLAASAICAAVPGDPLGLLMPVRMVVAGIAAAVMPGLLATALLRRRPVHPLESLALGVFGSFAIVAAIAMLTFATGLSITATCVLLWLVTAALAGGCLWSGRDWRPRRSPVRDVPLYVLIAVFAVVAFRWADDVKGVGWEVALHVAYVQQYASRLPLHFSTAVLRPPDIAAQNYFYLWECMLAVIARLANIDPLVAATKARWLIPVAGFGAFYFMVQQLARSTRAALAATWVMAAAVLTQWLTLPPNPYDTYIQSGALRQVGAFFGSIHHSDSAMEILLPLLIGVLFLALRANSVRGWAAFAVALVVAFLWHPREYFQVMWYGGVAIAVDVLVGTGRDGWWRRSRAYAAMLATYVLVAGGLYAGIPDSIRASSEHVEGLKRQFADLSVFAGSVTTWSAWTTGAWPMSTHLHGFEAPGLAAGPPLAFSWMVLAVIAASLIAVTGPRRFKQVAAYTLVLWLMSLSSFKWEELLQAITYHEILISKPRLIHLFAYTVIGLGWIEFVRSCARRPGLGGVLRASAAAVLAGFVFARAWQASVPSFAPMFAALNVLFFVALAALIVGVRWQGRTMRGPRLVMSPAVVGLTFALFALPASASSARTRWSAMLEHRVDAASFFDSRNPLGLQPDTIAYLRLQQPARTRMLVQPNAPHMLGVYAPVFVLPLLGNIGADMGELQMGLQGTHPVFGKAAQLPDAPLDGVKQYLDLKRIEYILATTPSADTLRTWPARDSAFQVVYQSADGRELVIHFTPQETR